MTFILSFLLNIASAQTMYNEPIVYLNSEQAAMQHLERALYKEFKLESDLKRIEKKYLPKKVREYGAWPILIVNLVNNRYISYTWKF